MDLDLSRLTEAERAEYAELLEQTYGGEGLADYIRRTRPAEPPPRHLLPLIDAFERARLAGLEGRQGVRICVSMPPRAGKSTTVRSAIAWWLLQRPADLCMYVSYNADIAARDQGYKTRAEAARVGVALSPNRAANDDWATVDGGGMRSCGINAGITGRGATGFVVVDDPYAGFEDGESNTIRQKVSDTFWGDVMSRVEGWASVIVVHTRFNEDDLIGELETNGGWEIIRIPAIAESDDDILGRKAGESFWPERHQYTLPELQKLQIAKAYVFAAMFQQKPQGRGQKMFGPARYYDPAKVDFTGCTAIIGVDPAASEKTAADWSVAVLLAIRDHENIMKATAYVVRVLRRQREIPDFAAELINFQRQGWHAPVAVESVGAFKAVPQLLRRHAKGIIVEELATPEELQGDKFLRAQSVAGAWNDGRVLIPNNNDPAIQEFLAVVKRFTGVKDKQDDDVDALSHGWNFITGGAMPIKRGSVPQPSRWR